MRLEAPKDVSWPDSMADFLNINDWDRISLNADKVIILQTRLVLCTGPLPCMVSLLGSGIEGAGFQRVGNGTLVCMKKSGCLGLYISQVRLSCAGSSTEPPAPSAPLEIEGAVLKLDNSSVVGCVSQIDGGSIRAYGGAVVQVTKLIFCVQEANQNLILLLLITNKFYAYIVIFNVYGCVPCLLCFDWYITCKLCMRVLTVKLLKIIFFFADRILGFPGQQKPR
jgi:hypothetical protein